MKKILGLILSVSVGFVACKMNDAKQQVSATDLNAISVKYIKLALTIGQYDADFVDAYYGPDSLKPAAVTDTILPLKKLQGETDSLLAEVRKIKSSITEEDSAYTRVNYLEHQLVAFGRRLKIASGFRESFEKESSELFSVNVPENNMEHFQQIINELDSILPGKGSIQERLDALNAKFVIPKDKLDTVFRTALAEARKRTLQHFTLPAEESFKLEYVTDKPWGGYNWYKGNYSSLIQINTDLPIMIDRAIDLACHEGYPGHHVYNMLLEKNLYHDKGWLEISLYPLFSPQSLIAEGSANYGIEMAFPGDEKINYVKQVLLPLAGLDTTNVSAYFKTIEIKLKLNYLRNEVARGLINKKLTEDEAVKMMMQYGLANEAGAKKSLSFIKKYGSYVICYNYGQDLVKHYVQADGTDPGKRWHLFGKLLSNPITPDILEEFWNAPGH